MDLQANAQLAGGPEWEPEGRAQARFREILRRAGHEEILLHALETFGSVHKAVHWLDRRNHIFEGETAALKIETDPLAVEAELTRIDHGVFI